LVHAANCHDTKFQPIAPNRISIAEIRAWSDKSEAESEANARLIAAAPDLLYALEELMPQITGQGYSLHFARAAIAKARNT
jgi:hypothetical protein